MTSAAWFLAALLAGASWRTGPQPSRACAHPVALDEAAPITRRVGCAPPGAGVSAPLRGPARLLFGGKLDLNCAAPLALEVLPGIGPARAGAIHAERCLEPFSSLGDVERVRGVGPVTVSRLAGVAEVVHASQRRGPCEPGCPPADARP